MSRAMLRLLAPVALLIAAACTDAFASNEAANALYAAGDFAGALERYRALQRDHPDWPELAHNAGNALHQLEQFDRALTNYDVALLSADRRVAAQSQYNRGNTLFRMERYAEARAAYVDALRLDPTDRDAKYNIEVIDRLSARDGPPEQQPGEQGPADGSPRPGEGEPADGGEGSGPPGGTAPPAGPGSETRPSAGALEDAIEDFRDALTPEEALRLLDALLAEQRGARIFIEGGGQRPGEPRY